jgi:hypothetical protein
MYSLGGHMVSSDDDMHPYCLMEDSPESLEDNEISRGRLHKVGQNGCVRKSFDIMSAFLDVLGKSASGIDAKLTTAVAANRARLRCGGRTSGDQG